MKKELVKALGERVRGIRLNLGLTQGEFAHRMKMSNTHLSDIETGYSGPGFYFFYRITKYHKVNPLYLLFGKQPIFLEEEEKKQEEEKQETGKRAPLETLDFGENTPRIREMLSYFQRSPMVKFAVLSFFTKYIVENTALIQEDIKLYEPKSEP